MNQKSNNREDGKRVIQQPYVFTPPSSPKAKLLSTKRNRHELLKSIVLSPNSKIDNYSDYSGPKSANNIVDIGISPPSMPSKNLHLKSQSITSSEKAKNLLINLDGKQPRIITELSERFINGDIILRSFRHRSAKLTEIDQALRLTYKRDFTETHVSKISYIFEYDSKRTKVDEIKKDITSKDDIPSKETISSKDIISPKETIPSKEIIPSKETIPSKEKISSKEIISPKETIPSKETISSKEIISPKEIIPSNDIMKPVESKIISEQDNETNKETKTINENQNQNQNISNSINEQKNESQSIQSNNLDNNLKSSTIIQNNEIIETTNLCYILGRTEPKSLHEKSILTLKLPLQTSLLSTDISLNTSRLSDTLNSSNPLVDKLFNYNNNPVTERSNHWKTNVQLYIDTVYENFLKKNHYIKPKYGYHIKFDILPYINSIKYDLPSPIIYKTKKVNDYLNTEKQETKIQPITDIDESTIPSYLKGLPKSLILDVLNRERKYKSTPTKKEITRFDTDLRKNIL